MNEDLDILTSEVKPEENDNEPIRDRGTASCKAVPKLMQVVLPAVILLWDELLFHLIVNNGISGSQFLSFLLSALFFGLLLGTIGAFLKDIPATILNSLLLGGTTVLFLVQTVYQGIFNHYLTWSVTGNAGDAAEFYKEALHELGQRIVLVIVLLIPVGLYVTLRMLKFKHRKFAMPFSVASAIATIVAALVFFLVINGKASRISGRKDLFFKEWMPDNGVKEYGIMIGLFQDVYRTATYDPLKMEEVVMNVTIPPVAPVATPTPTPTEPLTPEPTRPPEFTPTPTPTPIDKSPHVLSIDFNELAANEKNKNSKTIHEYFAQVEPTKKNKYTGMFEGYNLIMLTCETFSPLCVSEELTPTLYRLIHTGFCFENFYTPYWMTSTSDAEYVVCTGLLPDTQMSNSFSRSSVNSMPLCLGHIFTGMGYSAYAFHDHWMNYYSRDLSHPNMGYEYYARGRGLTITPQFPESDLEMMEQSIPMYIEDEHFHVYYMTVSGHMGYEWDENAMGRKHRSEVKDLPYSEQAKCYIAANLELEAAVTYLIDTLEEAGVLDNTLIVLTGDHYPYGLSDAARNELAGHKIDPTFERYENHLVIWNPNMEPITVSKLGCSLDVMPTILNLLGIEYDSRLYMGTDLLSDSLSLVQFADGSFITDYVRYDAGGRKAIWVNGSENWDDAYREEYLNIYKSVVKNKFTISRAILNNNYYKYIAPYLWWMR